MKKIFNYIFSFLILTLTLNSCEVDRTESVFVDTPSERIEKTIGELRTLLLSQEQGFSGIYFPNNSVVGGVNFYMNFTQDLRVKITSDFKEDTSITDSRYDIVTGTTAAELIFTSGSRHITDLVQDGAAGFDSFFGNNSFQYVGEENGVITFRDIRSDGIFVISPSGFGNFEAESVLSANTTYIERQNFTNVDCATESVFNQLVMQINSGSEIINYILSYNPDNIFFDAETTNAQGISASQNFGAAFTLINGESALKISPAIEVGDNSFESFILNQSTDSNQYVATVNGATATISSISLSEPSGEDIDPEVPTFGPNGYLYRPSLGGDPLTSNCFREEIIGQMETNMDNLFGAGRLTFFDFIFFFDFNSDACANQLLIRFDDNATGDLISIRYCFDRGVILNDRLYQNYIGTFGNPLDDLLEGAVMPLLDFFNSPIASGVPSGNGLLYTNEGTFFNAGFNVDGTFTNLDTPSYRVQALFFNP
ncbi:DUF4302 domain-containing protein [uncultured Algibacter sp.]|uniref:DUF4302 domain-containing protein n=1 Tax=uncultured Algibacter sp. TaxID=298659 RepID=UPI003217A5F4